MTNYSFFANSAQLQVNVGATECPVAALRNVSFTPRYEHAELRGIESTHRLAVAKYNLDVDVRCEYAMWDVQTDYILSSFLNGAFLTSPTAAPATDANDAGYRAKVALFNITATVYDTTRAQYMTATIYNVYFNDVPMELNENTYMQRNLTGKGESISYMYKSA